MADAFLHRRSIFDKHKDSYSFKNPIKQMRVSRSWSNPITRHKREKGILDWAGSFAGKRHYRKLARHNATHMHEDYMDNLNIPATYSGSTLTLAGGSVVTGVSPGIRGKCNITINAVREGDFVRLIPDWDEQGNVFDREVHHRYELDYTNHGTKYDHSIAYLDDLGALAHHEAFHLCEEHMSYDIKDLRDKLRTYLKNEVEKVDLDYDVKALEDSPYPSLAITSKPDDGHYYLEGYLIELKPGDVRFKYQYYGHPHEEVVIVGDDAQDLDVIAKYLFAQVEPKAAADEGASFAEKTAWTYLEELEKLEGEESRVEAAEKILKALGCKPGTEGCWYSKDGDEIDVIDTLDNTEWAFAQKVCGQLQEAKQAKKVYPKFVQISTQGDFDKYIKPALGKGADAYGLSDIKGMWWEIADGEKVPASAKTAREIRDSIDKRPRFVFISGVGDERGITDMPLTEYASEMGMSVSDYLRGYTVESKNEVADKAGFSAFVRELVDAAFGKFDDETWDRITLGYDVGRDFEQGYSVEDTMHRIQDWAFAESKKPGSKFTEIKAAIKSAWSAAEVKWFRLDFQESTERLDIYPIASDNEGVSVNWGVLPERNTIVQYATDFHTGNSEIEREMPYKDLDELEKVFVDEFKAMDETLEVSAENGADIHPLSKAVGESYREDVILQILDQDNNTHSREDLEGKTVAELEEIYSELINLAAKKGEAYGGARFGKYDLVQALAKALHNDEDDKYSIRYFDSNKVGIEPGYAYASNKEGEDAWKVLDDGTVEFEFAGKPQGKAKVDSLGELESTILKLFGLQLGSNGEASESLKKNFRFKDPKSDDDLIAIQDIVYEINRRNKSQAVAEKISSELESLMVSASRDPKWKEMSDEECASAMYKAAQPILSKITSEQLEEIFRNPGHDHEYFRDAIEYDEEAEEPEYRADDLYDFSSIRHESKCEWLDPEGEAVLKKQAPKLIDALNAEFKRIGSPARLELASDDVHFSDGYYLPVKCSGKWDEESRMLNARLEGTKALNGVKYYDGNIYLEKGWRPTSFRGARWLALHEKLEKMGERMGDVSFADLGADPTDTPASHRPLENALSSFERAIWDKYDTDADYIKLRLSIYRKDDKSDKPLYTVQYKAGEAKPWQLRKGSRGALIGSFETAKQLAKDFKKIGGAAEKHEVAEAGITSRDVQAAARSAWSTSGATDFKLDIVRLGDNVIIYTKGLDGKDSFGISWHINIPDAGGAYTIEQYADWGTDRTEPERKWNVKDLDGLEASLEDEFKALQETIDIGKEN